MIEKNKCNKLKLYKNRQTTEICFESLIEKNETLFKLKTEKKSFIKKTDKQNRYPECQANREKCKNESLFRLKTQK